MLSQRTGTTVNDDFDTDHGKLSAHDAPHDAPHDSHYARQCLASNHAALFPTRLALARWSGGGVPHLHAGEPLLRAAWFAHFQRNHQAWLERGGFAQHDDVASLKHPAMWQPSLPGQHQAHQVAAPGEGEGEAGRCGTCADREDDTRGEV